MQTHTYHSTEVPSVLQICTLVAFSILTKRMSLLLIKNIITIGFVCSSVYIEELPPRFPPSTSVFTHH